jgi:tetratricopeptide (TPR) repeat protein
LERLAHENPDRAEFVQESGRTSNALAIALTQVNRTVDALAAYEKSRATREKLARENPGVAEYAQELALTYNNMATLLRTLGRPDDAVASCKKAKEVQEKLATEHPDIFDYQQDLARTCNNLGILYADQFKRTDAIAESRRAVAIQEKLAETQPRNVQLLHELAKSSHNLGRFLAALGRFDEAIPAFARAKELRQRFAGDSAAQPAHFTELAESHLALCRAHRDRRQFDESLTEVTRVLALCEKVPESQATILCRTALAEQAMSLSLAGRHAEALADWDRALKLADAASLPLLQLRRATAQVRGGDSTGLEIAKTAAANPNADAAILLEAARSFALSADPAHRANSFELLKRALDAGAFRDPAQILALKTDPDFAVLQNLPDFAAWLEKLEATER